MEGAILQLECDVWMCGCVYICVCTQTLSRVQLLVTP